MSAATMIGAQQAGHAEPVEECTSVMTPIQGHGCTLDLAPGHHRIRVDMVSVTGTYRVELRDSTGVRFYDASCTVELTHGQCSGSSGGSQEASADGSGGGIRSFVVVTHTYDYVSATLSKGGTASLVVGPGTGAITLDAS